MVSEFADIIRYFWIYPCIRIVQKLKIGIPLNAYYLRRITKEQLKDILTFSTSDSFMQEACLHELQCRLIDS